MKALLKVAAAVFVSISTSVLGAGGPPGTVIGWGNNISGQATGIPSFPLSNGVLVVTANPFATGMVTIAGHVLSNATVVAAGFSHSLALMSDGTVMAWGGNIEKEAVGFETPSPNRAFERVRISGQILSNVTAIEAGRNFSLALKKDGTVVAWGANQAGQTAVPDGLRNVVAISAGDGRCLAARKDGSVVRWGSDPRSYGHFSNIVAVTAAQLWHDLALRKDGTVVELSARGNESTVPLGLSNVVSITAGAAHALALKADGTVFGWGANDDGQATGIPSPGTPGEPRVASGLVTLNGEVLNDVISIAANRLYSLALKKDGTVVIWGDKRSYKDVPAGLTNIKAISAGEDFCLGITSR